MKIAVLDDYQNVFRKLACYSRLAGHEVTVYNDTEKDPVRLAERLKDAEAVILTQQRSAFPKALVDRLPNLKLISQTGRNVSHVDVAACTAKGVTVSAGGAGNPNPTAELTWALILGALRNLPDEVARLKGGQWQGSVGTGLAGKTLGVYAYGRIGSLVAQAGRAFGMKVVCLGRDASLKKAKEAGFEIAASRESFFESCDVIALHLPLNKETTGIVKAADLARMKPTALIVNTSRAQIIEAGALEKALRAGRPGRAAVDVYEDEPVLNADHPLIKLPNCLCSPHLGYVEEGTMEMLMTAAIDQILAFAAGKPINVVNPEVAPR